MLFLLVVVVDQRLVDADAGVVVHVAGLGHADDRVDQERAAHLGSGALGQLFVDAVQRVAGLEGHHVGVPHALEHLAHLGGRAAQLDEVIIAGKVYDLERTD